MSEQSTYTPRPGSVADRCMQHLRVHGTTATTPLADAIDHEAKQLPACLSTAVKFGAIRSEKRNGLLYWSIGDGTPPARLDDGEVDDDPVVQRLVPANPAEPKYTPRAPSKAADLGHATSGREGATPNNGADPQGLRIALWDDGVLHVQRGVNDLVLFTAEETRQLVRYLERMAECEA